MDNVRVSSGDVDIEGREGTSTGGSSDTVGENLVADLLEVAVGEDETDVACKNVNGAPEDQRNGTTHP